MKCLIVKHPFAGYIVDDVKCIEYRSRPTKIRDRIGIIQSGTGTVIGDVILYYCKYNDESKIFDWYLSGARRYLNPVPVTMKRGPVVWMDVDYEPDTQEICPRLHGDAFRDACTSYRNLIQEWFQQRNEILLK